MINNELLNFIKEQTAKGVQKEKITEMLTGKGGWMEDDVNEAYEALNLYSSTYQNALKKVAVGTPENMVADPSQTKNSANAGGGLSATSNVAPKMSPQLGGKLPSNLPETQMKTEKSTTFSQPVIQTQMANQPVATPGETTTSVVGGTAPTVGREPETKLHGVNGPKPFMYGSSLESNKTNPLQSLKQKPGSVMFQPNASNQPPQYQSSIAQNSMKTPDPLSRGGTPVLTQSSSPQAGINQPGSRPMFSPPPIPSQAHPETLPNQVPQNTPGMTPVNQTDFVPNTSVSKTQNYTGSIQSPSLQSFTNKTQRSRSSMGKPKRRGRGLIFSLLLLFIVLVLSGGIIFAYSQSFIPKGTLPILDSMMVKLNTVMPFDILPAEIIGDEDFIETDPRVEEVELNDVSAQPPFGQPSVDDLAQNPTPPQSFFVNRVSIVLQSSSSFDVFTSASAINDELNGQLLYCNFELGECVIALPIQTNQELDSIILQLDADMRVILVRKVPLP